MVNDKQNARNEKGQFASNTNTWRVRKHKDGKVYYCFLDGELLFFTDDPRAREKSWAKLADGYAATRVDGEEIPAHRFISKPNANEVVDHINRNKKDNRISNLRNTNKSVNAFNSKVRSDNKSGAKGVWYRKDTKRWCAEIKKDGKKYTLGCFGSKEEAIAARSSAERILYGEFKTEG